MGTVKIAEQRTAIRWLVHWPHADGWGVTFGTAMKGLGGPAQYLPVVPNVTAHPSTARVQASYYSMWHYLCTIKS